jgi:hypothetical protein
MKKNMIIYWLSTALFSVMMLFSAYSYFTKPELAAAFTHLGFPAYFRVELGTAKFLGAIALIIPQVPMRIKEWAYAGFGITFISAAIAHISRGDPAAVAAMPLIFLVVMVISYIYLHKKNKPAAAVIKNEFKTSLA